MFAVSPKLYRTCLLAALSLAVFNFGCGKKPLTTRNTAPERTAEAPRPTVTFQADPTSINKGESTTLTWSTTNATQVAIAPEVGPVSDHGSDGGICANQCGLFDVTDGWSVVCRRQ